jgi:hypothetical protein
MTALADWADASLLTERDPEILGVANSIDGMGVLAVWSARGRDLIPHLTAQTTSARGFQVLLEALRLIEVMARSEPAIAERTADAFMVIEQVFARLVAEDTGDWPLRGARRARGRVGQSVMVSVVDRSWHLQGAQLGNGLWGLYRGAASRAGLLDASSERLSDDAMTEAAARPIVSSSAAMAELTSLVAGALDGASVSLNTSNSRPLVDEILAGWHALPLRDLLQRQIVLADELTTNLATVLLEAASDDVPYRDVLAMTATRRPDRLDSIEGVRRCEDLLSVLESVFFYACAAGEDRTSLVEAAAGLEIDLNTLQAVADEFAASGVYDGVAKTRAEDYVRLLKTESTTALLESVLEIHGRVARARGRALWVWVDDQDRLVADVSVGAPKQEAFEVGTAWRNDYFLSSLQSVARELAEVAA